MQLFGSGRARDEPGAQPEKRKKISYEDFKGRKASVAVLKECLTHPATIYPLFGGSGLGLMWMLMMGVSPPVVLFILGSAFVGGSSLIWNYVVKGPEKGSAYIRNLIAEQRQQQFAELKELAQECDVEGFVDGAAAADELCASYERLRDYLATQKQGTAVDRYSILAADGVRDAVQLLENAVALFKAGQSIDVKTLEEEVTTWTAQRELTDDGSSPARKLDRQITAQEERIKLCKQNQESLSTLLDRVADIQWALETTYLQKVDLAALDPTLFMAEDGGAASRLRSAVNADRRVRERLANTDSERERKMKKYLKDAGRLEDETLQGDGDAVHEEQRTIE